MIRKICQLASKEANKRRTAGGTLRTLTNSWHAVGRSFDRRDRIVFNRIQIGHAKLTRGTSIRWQSTRVDPSRRNLAKPGQTRQNAIRTLW